MRGAFCGIESLCIPCMFWLVQQHFDLSCENSCRFTILNLENVLPTVSSAVQMKLYLEIMDFENHLDNPVNDHWNTALNGEIEQLSWRFDCNCS